MYNLREYIQNDICCGQERSGAKADGHGLWFAGKGSVNDVVVRCSYPKCCFLLAIKWSARLIRE